MNTSTFEQSTKPRAVEEFVDFYFYRRIAAFFVPILHKLKFTPNMVTWMSLVFGVISSWAIYRKYIFLGVGLFLFSIFFDCADGQLARITGTSGPIGRALDGFVDLICVVCLWCAIFFGSVLEGATTQFHFSFLVFAGLSMLFHCWRYDNVKIKSLELVETNYHETDLDYDQAMILARSELKSFRILNAFLASMIALQMYFFIRGGNQKQKITITSEQRSHAREVLEPHMRFWSWLGVGHHNTIVLLGLLISPWTLWGLWVAFFVIAVPMNIGFVLGEFRFARVYGQIQKNLMRSQSP